MSDQIKEMVEAEVKAYRAACTKDGIFVPKFQDGCDGACRNVIQAAMEAQIFSLEMWACVITSPSTKVHQVAKTATVETSKVLTRGGPDGYDNPGTVSGRSD
jgi:hypothetical protein